MQIKILVKRNAQRYSESRRQYPNDDTTRKPPIHVCDTWHLIVRLKAVPNSYLAPFLPPTIPKFFLPPPATAGKLSSNWPNCTTTPCRDASGRITCACLG